MNIRLHFATLIIAMAALSSLPTAYAQVLAVETIEGTYPQLVSHGWQAIPVSLGKMALQFETSKKDVRVVVTYNTSCTALAFNVYVRAKVDGVIANPGVGKGSVLCYSTLTGSAYPASRAFSTVIAMPGVHSVTLELQGDQNAGVIIGDSILIVQQ